VALEGDGSSGGRWTGDGMRGGEQGCGALMNERWKKPVGKSLRLGRPTVLPPSIEISGGWAVGEGGSIVGCATGQGGGQGRLLWGGGPKTAR